TVGQTMMVAQHLYENGHITYMRTVSLNLSQLAIGTIKAEIENNIGAEYLKVRKYHTSSKGAQEAHEAIRPTYINKHDIEGTPQEKRLYNLIWKRTIASQMADAVIEKTSIDIVPDHGNDRFTATGEVIKFDGFLKVYIEGHDDENVDSEMQSLLPAMHEGDAVAMTSVTAQQRYTQHPPRYTEASLVKKMEELGIGRPSTYAPTISTIQQREYVEKGDRPGTERPLVTLTMMPGSPVKETKKVETAGADKGKLLPTDIGVVVNDFLTEYFPDILDYNFTARVEERFDEIAEGKLPWTAEMAEFYGLFHPAVDSALNMHLEHKVGERVLGNDPVSGKPVSVKIGRFGPLVQMGDGEGDEKPQFASLLKGQSVSTITLEEALKLFEFPRTLGDYEDKTVTVAIGRFGPYVKHDNKFISIPKAIAPAALTLDEAIELIDAKREADSKKVVKTFDKDPDLQLLRGPYGIYISYKKSNYKIPKTVSDPASLTLDECMAIVEKAPAPKPRRKKA
ncbi:MAG: DNA topoisomerase I, partial [Muribaculaceae bacterium]|nr:DNA topoisomerase I [Muribaculaceae bacterium]